MTIEIVACSEALGAEIRNIDLSEKIDAASAADLRKAWADNLILLIRGAGLRDAQRRLFHRLSCHRILAR